MGDILDKGAQKLESATEEYFNLDAETRFLRPELAYHCDYNLIISIKSF